MLSCLFSPAISPGRFGFLFSLGYFYLACCKYCLFCVCVWLFFFNVLLYIKKDRAENNSGQGDESSMSPNLCFGI